VLVPVPLHPDKERSRGYNQSLWFAKGLGVAFPNALLSENTLLRLHNAGSQTRRRRMERYQNVSASFALREGRAVAGKHVLLVDDVMTTGATLETCGQLLLDAHAASLSLATIAVAVNR
jgi:ComF family protein